MLVEDQSEAIAFLKEQAAEGRSSEAVEIFETHISIVVVAGKRAFKLKRAVRLPYVDFSTREWRLAACEREITLNRRTAPALYLGVRRITREVGGRLVFDGSGPLVDAVVEMLRFDQAQLFDKMAMEGRLTPPLMTRLAGEIARFHGSAEADLSRSGSGNIEAVLGINERAFATSHVFDPDSVAAFARAFRDALAHHAPLLDARAKSGKVRHCHGDLHLRNICLFNGEPTLFDCLEFDDAMATIDVLYDLAFLLMDMWHRDLREHANLVFNRYLDQTEESDGLPLVPFFMAIRAAVRAHVAATAIEEQPEGERAESLRSDAQAYFDLALALLAPDAPRLVAIGGLSGSGKSTIAAGIAPSIGAAPGARVVSSDRMRKRLHGVTAETRLPGSAYLPAVSQQVYAMLAGEAEAALGRGHGVVADAVFDRTEDRARIGAIAEAVGVNFTGIWLDAGPAVLVERVEKRQGDPSDATAEVVRDQLRRLHGTIEWIKADADGDPSATLRSALDAIAHAAERPLSGDRQ